MTKSWNVAAAVEIPVCFNTLNAKVSDLHDMKTRMKTLHFESESDPQMRLRIDAGKQDAH